MRFGRRGGDAEEEELWESMVELMKIEDMVVERDKG